MVGSSLSVLKLQYSTGVRLLLKFVNGNTLPHSEYVNYICSCVCGIMQDWCDEEILADVCWALNCITKGGVDYVRTFIREKGALLKLVSLLSYPSSDVVT